MRRFYIIIQISLLFFFNTIEAQESKIAEFLTYPEFAEFKNITAPTISFDGHYFAFVVKDNETSKIYESQFVEGKWQKPVEIKVLTKKFGSKKLNSPAYNYDGRVMYFSVLNGNFTDIFYIKRQADGWSEPVALPSTVNTTYDDGEPSISADDNLLYFVRFENKDEPEWGEIYYSTRDKNGKWSEAKALTEPINTGNERTPRISADNKTLFFSSKRLKDKHYKLYSTVSLYGDFWTIPQAVFSAKSSDDQLYPSISQNSQIIYYSSIQSSKKATIVYDTLPTSFLPKKSIFVTGKVLDINNKPINANIYVRDPASMKILGRYTNNSQTAKYQLFFNKGVHSILDFNSPGYSHYFVDFNSDSITGFKDTINAKLFDSVTVKLNVYDKDIYEPLDVDINVFDKDSTKLNNIQIKKSTKGKYQLTLPLGKKIIIKLSGFYIKNTDVDIDLSGVVLFKNFEKNVEIESEKTPYIYTVVDKQTGKGVKCTVTLVDKKTKKRIVTTATTDENGKVTIYLRKGGSYDVTINPQGYAFYSEQLDLDTAKRTSKKVELQALKKDVVINIPNINFELNSAELKVESYPQLNKLIELMKKNPQIKVEISAHTDDLGSEQYNLKLSEKRAKSVVDYMLMNDVPSDRIIAKGYGETSPLVPNTSEENRAKNRRVELKIIEVNE